MCTAHEPTQKTDGGMTERVVIEYKVGAKLHTTRYEIARIQSYAFKALYQHTKLVVMLIFWH